MTKKIFATPRVWLTLDACSRIFETFQKTLEYDEPFPPFTTRYKGKLEGILESTRQTFDKELLNPSILEASAAYFNNIIRGHPFINGNKRMGVLFTHVFLIINNINFTLTFKEMYNFAVIVASASNKGIKSETTKKWCKKIIYNFTKEIIK